MEHYRMNSPTVMSETIDGEVIAINLDSGCYHSLRGGAARVWEDLAAGHSVQDILRHADGPQDAARQALTGFVSELCGLELLLPTTQAQAAEDRAAGDQAAGAAQAGGWKPDELRVESFRDMQDLLLLDPVHDVSVEAGWPVRK